MESGLEAADDGIALEAQASEQSISKATIEPIANQAYTGKAVTPVPKVTLGDKLLSEGTDYSLSYKYNVKAGKATITVTGKGEYTGSKSATFKIVTPSVSYSVHVQTYGDQKARKDGGVAGTSGESKRLEALEVKFASNLMAGSIRYRTQVQSYGWLGWARNGETSGTANLSRRMKTLQIKILPKGSAAPGSTENAFVDKVPFTSGDAELDAILNTIIETRTGRGPDALQKAFNYVVSFPYIDGEAALQGDWRVWSINKAKQMYYRTVYDHREC